MLTKILAGLSLLFVILTAGCGLTIRFGGEQFKEALNGHIVLGMISLLLAAATFITLLRSGS